MNSFTEMADIFRLVGDVNRLQILLTCLKKSVPVTALGNNRVYRLPQRATVCDS